MTTRIYMVANEQSVRLVRAGNQAQALRHVAKTSYMVRLATQDDCVMAAGKGTKVEEVDAEDESE